MYDLFYDFYYGNLLDTSYLNDFTLTLMNNSINLRVYLSHTLTIISIALCLVALWCFAKWLIKMFGGLFKW